MHHEGCSGRPGRVELLTGIESALLRLTRQHDQLHLPRRHAFDKRFAPTGWLKNRKVPKRMLVTNAH
jgi:hypothetical protein